MYVDTDVYKQENLLSTIIIVIKPGRAWFMFGCVV
jgi:hypothetical protein